MRLLPSFPVGSFMKCLIQSWLTILKGIPPSKRDERSNDEDHLGLEDLDLLEDPEAHGREF